MKPNTTKKQDAFREAYEGHNESSQVIKKHANKKRHFRKTVWQIYDLSFPSTFWIRL